MSDSETTQQANTSSTDQRRVLGQGALSAENSNVRMTTIHNTLDADVANHAIDATRLSTAEAMGFGSDALASSFSFGKSIFNTASDSQTNAFSGALSAIDKSGARASNFASDAFGAALDFGNDAMKRENAVLDKTTSVLNSAYADAKGRGAMTDKILIGAVAMAGLVALAAIKK